MGIKTILGALSLLGMVGGCAAQLPKSQINNAGQILFNGYRNAKADCYRCHTGTGLGGTWGPSFKNTPRLSDAAVLRVIDEGPGIMPPYKDALSLAEKQEIVSWLRETFGPHKAK